MPDISETKMVIATDGSCKLGTADGCAIYIIHPRPALYTGPVERIVDMICSHLTSFAKANNMSALQPLIENLRKARLPHTGPVAELTAACMAITLAIMARMGAWIITDCNYVLWICARLSRHDKPKAGNKMPNSELVSLVHFLMKGLKEYFTDYKFDIFLYKCPSHQLRPAIFVLMEEAIIATLPDAEYGLYVSGLQNWIRSNDRKALPSILELYYIAKLYAKCANEVSAGILKLQIGETYYYLPEHFMLCANHVVDRFASYKHYGRS